MKAHYLSPASQNEFINECGQFVMDAVLEEAFDSIIFFTIITGGTPDSSHTEQTIFILQFALSNSSTKVWEIEERFLL